MHPAYPVPVQAVMSGSRSVTMRPGARQERILAAVGRA